MSERLPSATWRLLGLELALDEPEQRLREHAAQLVGLDVEELRAFVSLARRWTCVSAAGPGGYVSSATWTS
jgi:hypothetical protein